VCVRLPCICSDLTLELDNKHSDISSLHEQVSLLKTELRNTKKIAKQHKQDSDRCVYVYMCVCMVYMCVYVWGAVSVCVR
jgi:hypothetical protein